MPNIVFSSSCSRRTREWAVEEAESEDRQVNTELLTEAERIGPTLAHSRDLGPFGKQLVGACGFR